LPVRWLGYRRTQMSSIIVIEGADMQGKTTQSKMLLQSLYDAGYRTALFEIPYNGGGWSYRAIYWALKNGFAKRHPNVFQVFHFFNKLGFQLFRLPEVERDYNVIVLARWKLSSVVYGEACGTNSWLSRFMYRFLRKPTITFVLDGASYSRPGAPDSYEKDSDLQTRVKAGYREWARKNMWDHVIIDSHGSPQEVSARIVEVLNGMLPRPNVGMRLEVQR